MKNVELESYKNFKEKCSVLYSELRTSELTNNNTENNICQIQNNFNELQEKHMISFQQEMINKNIFSQVSYILHSIDSLMNQVDIEFKYQKSQKIAILTMNNKSFMFNIPDLKDILKMFLREDDRFFPTLYLFYAKEENRESLEAAISVSMLKSIL